MIENKIFKRKGQKNEENRKKRKEERMESVVEEFVRGHPWYTQRAIKLQPRDGY